MSSTEDRPEREVGAPEWWSHPDRPEAKVPAADGGAQADGGSAAAAAPDGEVGHLADASARPAQQQATEPPGGAWPRDPWGAPEPGVQYGGAQYGGVQHGDVQYGGAQYGDALYGHVPYGDAAWGAAPRRRPQAIVAGALLLAVLSGGIGGGIGAYLQNRDTGGRITLPQVSDDAVNRAPGGVAGIARAALPGVVYIHVKGPKEEGTGTGFVLDTSGRILTNNHVVSPAGSSGSISVTFNDGQSRKATVVGRDSGYDLAVIKVSGVSGLAPLTLGDSDSVQVGDPVVAIGAPFGLEGTVTSGIISATHRPITSGGDDGGVSYVDALQTDAPINPGNSGGPLMDAKGRVVGINSAIRSAGAGTADPFGADGQAGSVGLGFAIPVNEAKRVAEQLVNDGKAVHPVIGVTLDVRYGGDGAKVLEKADGGSVPITPGGPGAKAGVRPGDVIVSADGRPVHDGDQLVVFIRSHKPGDTIELGVQRGGHRETLDVTLGSG